MEDKLGKFRTVSSNARSVSAMEKTFSDFETSVEKNVNSEIDCDITSSDEHITFSSKKSSKDTLNNEGSSSQQSNSIPYIEIYQESVNYLGYYSSHEQLMQQLILDKANTTQKHIKDMVAKGKDHFVIPVSIKFNETVCLSVLWMFFKVWCIVEHTYCGTD